MARRWPSGRLELFGKPRQMAIRLVGKVFDAVPKGARSFPKPRFLAGSQPRFLQKIAASSLTIY
jgi:hypothetical protein